MVKSGFVDLQVNGYLGVDFSSDDLTSESFIYACMEMLKTGTRAFLPTIITSPVERYEKLLPLMADVLARDEFSSSLLGFHIEGPFISDQPGAIGAHNPHWVKQCNCDLLDNLQTLAQGKIRLLTIAAELDGAAELTRHAVKMGIAVSLGHQAAGSDDLASLASVGGKALTHLGNGVPNILPRHDNPIWAGLGEERLSAMLVADGHHLPAPVLKSMIRAKGWESVIIVSDASPAAGLSPGKHRVLGNDAVLEPDGRLINPEVGCLVGSSATMSECMKHVEALGILNDDQLHAVGCTNALKLIGLA